MIRYNRIFLLLLNVLFAASSAQAGKISYPAAGNYLLNEGTLEVWLTPMVEEMVPPDDGKYYKVFDIFHLKVPEEWSIISQWYRHNSQIGLKVTASSRDVEFGGGGALGSEPPPPWKPGQMHHMAFVWKDNHIWLYADGELRSSKTFGKGFWGSLADADLVFGYGKDEYDGPNKIIMNAIKVSFVAKDENSLKDARPTADLATLLLDRFDTQDGISDGVSMPEISYTLQESTVGTLIGEWEYVTSPTPGIAFYKK